MLRAPGFLSLILLMGLAVPLSGCPGPTTDGGDDGDDDDDDNACAAGSEGCPCTQGGSCDAPLTCDSNLCVDSGGQGNNDGIDGGESDIDGGEVLDAGSGGKDLPAFCAPTSPMCQDEQILAFSLQSTPSNKGVDANEPDGFGGFVSTINATGNGAFGAPAPFVYAKFTTEGLVKVAIDDESALSSMGWDLAFRRYIVRTNSGVSGPSCMRTAELPSFVTFESVTVPPFNDSLYHVEEYMNPSCELVADDSGLPPEVVPPTTLAGYWENSNGCAQMTDIVFVIELQDGHHVKFQVLSYYSPPATQDGCDADEGVGGTYTSAMMRVRWAFLD